MNTATIVKSAAVVCLIAAIPITMLWRQNVRLEDEVQQLRSAARTAPAPPPAAVKRAGPLTASSRAVEPDTSTTAPGDKASAPAAPAQNMATAMAAFFSGDRMKQMAERESKKRVNLAYNRICLNLPDLTDDQKAQIRAALEKKSAEETAAAMKLIESGGIAKMMNPSNLTKEERALMSKMDPRRQSAVSDDAALKAILTEEQYAQHTKAQETRRVSDAENAATDTLRAVGRSIDLNPEQKDQLFQQLAQYDLTKEEASLPEPRGPFGGSAPDEKREEIIRSNLTPQQLEAYDQSRAEERASREQMRQFFPGGASGAPPAGK